MIWSGSGENLATHFKQVKGELLQELAPFMANMEKRGGGLSNLQLHDRSTALPGYYQLWADFRTCDAMGANFINSALECLAKTFQQTLQRKGKDIEIVMAILSNYTPECLLRAKVSCPIAELEKPDYGMDAANFACKFARAVRIAEVDVHRATTHNKGIMNGIDAVVLATGNDFRAVEACAHTYASRDGTYRPLTHCDLGDGVFSFTLEFPSPSGRWEG